MQVFRFYRLRRRSQDTDIERGGGGDGVHGASAAPRDTHGHSTTSADVASASLPPATDDRTDDREDGEDDERRSVAVTAVTASSSTGNADSSTRPQSCRPQRRAATAAARRWRALLFQSHNANDTRAEHESDADGLDDWEEIDDDFLIRRSSPGALAR